MERWQATLRLTRTVKLLITNAEGDEVLRARLPRRCDHPRALLTLLEGLALWSGAPLIAAVSVDDSVRHLSDAHLFGGQVWPAESALVRVEFCRRRRPARLRGLGSFRDLLADHAWGGRR